uniref:MULE transposase domain-containing protein n=1 Tax=Lactuca sativa TaxID=4236 RepID=A0A9R1V5W5_LACSA|nr:hypothetical protein LSAT_V11C600337370 [Lactuca sativa]
MDYERENVIVVSFQIVNNPFLTKLSEDESEYFGEKDEYVDDLVHLEDDENDIGGSNYVHDPTIEWNLMEPKWIASHLVKEIVFNSSIKLKELRELIRTKFNITLSISKRNRAKHKAMVMIEGKAEIQRSNPCSIVQVGVNLNSDGKHYFHRFYVCFHALKTRWIAGCRRVIRLDGCFLKGRVKGQLLTVIGRDANNQVYPICWAVVDIENKQNWKRFFELLRGYLA